MLPGRTHGPSKLRTTWLSVMCVLLGVAPTAALTYYVENRYVVLRLFGPSHCQWQYQQDIESQAAKI